MAAGTFTSWVLARVAAPAGNGFAVTNRGKKLNFRHGFPFNMLKATLFERMEVLDCERAIGGAEGICRARLKRAAQNDSEIVGGWLLVLDQSEYRLQGLSVFGQLSALFKDSFKIEVAGIGNICGPGRCASGY